MRTGARTGMVARVAPLLAWVGLGTGFVIALAAALRMAGSVPDGDHVTGAIRLPGPVTAAILTLFGLALVVFLGDLVRRALSKGNREDDGAPADEPTPVPPWLRWVSLLLSLVNVAVLAYLWRRAVLEGGLLTGAGGLASGLRAAGRGGPDRARPLQLGLRKPRGDGRPRRARPRPVERARRSADPGRRGLRPALPAAPLGTAVDESLEDLRAEGDPRRAIVRCYARFERAAADSGLERRPWLTPTEFMREVLARLSLPRAAVPTLTGLFELARFSHHPLGPAERDRAVDALHEIRRRCAVSEGDAGAG